MRALIVDDSAVMRKVVERAVRQAGIELTDVLQAADGNEALERLRTAAAEGLAVALIFSDINMPGMDGLTFLEQKKAEGLAMDAPVIMITTEGAEPQVLRAIAAGARGYICKPFTAEQIKARVAPLLAGIAA